LGRLKFGEARPVVLQDDDFVIEGLSSSEMAMLMELLNKVKHNTYRTRRPSHIEISETINA